MNRSLAIALLATAGSTFLAGCESSTSPNNDSSTSSTCQTPTSASSDITVTAPNCGGTWKIGDTVTMTWKTGANFSSAKVQLRLPDGNLGYAYSTGSVDTTFYKWIVPDSIYDLTLKKNVSTIGSGYRVLISDYVDNSIRDSSDVAFSITKK